MTASLLAPLKKGAMFFRTALFAPVVTTVVAVAVIWRYLLHTRYGLVNQVVPRADAKADGHGQVG